MYNNTDESHKHMLSQRKQDKEHVYYYFIMYYFKTGKINYIA